MGATGISALVGSLDLANRAQAMVAASTKVMTTWDAALRLESRSTTDTSGCIILRNHL